MPSACTVSQIRVTVRKGVILSSSTSGSSHCPKIVQPPSFPQHHKISSFQMKYKLSTSLSLCAGNQYERSFYLLTNNALTTASFLCFSFSQSSVQALKFLVIAGSFRTSIPRPHSSSCKSNLNWGHKNCQKERIKKEKDQTYCKSSSPKKSSFGLLDSWNRFICASFNLAELNKIARFSNEDPQDLISFYP